MTFAGLPAASDLTRAKAARLAGLLADLDSVIVAFSGGVDSAYLAYVAHATLGARSCAITADSPSYPRRHREMALAVARQCQLHHEIIRTNEMARPEYPRESRRSLLPLQARAAIRISSRSRTLAGFVRSSMAATPTIASTIDPVVRRLANSACGARSMRWISRKRKFVSCHGAQSCPSGTSRHRRACLPASRIVTK